MTGKHLYKNSAFLILFLILGLLINTSLKAAEATTNRHNLVVNFLHLTDQEIQWNSLEQLKALQAAILQISNDGLTPQHYQINQLNEIILRLEQTGADITAAEDVMVTAAFLEAIADLMLGRTRNSHVEPYLNFTLHSSDKTTKVIELALQYINEPEVAFTKARPQNDEYHNLLLAYQKIKDKLNSYSPRPILPETPSLRLGMADDRVILLRQRLEIPSYDTELNIYDTQVLEAVKEFQREQGLVADGIAGPQTLGRLNRTLQQDLDTIKANLERWRRVNFALNENRIIANTAGTTLDYYHQDSFLLRTRTQVGRQDRQTPLMISEVSHFTVNPTWTIPPTIYRNDKLPAIQKDPSYLNRNRLTVLDRNGNTIDPRTIDWNNPGNIFLRQAAGPHNALGQVVIRFPNDQSIYLHDTPNQGLFNRDQRFFSSGCVRVEGVKGLAELMLENSDPENLSTFRSILNSGVTRNVSLRSPITIILGYWTVEASHDGNLIYYTDAYDFDREILKELELSSL